MILKTIKSIFSVALYPLKLAAGAGLAAILLAAIFWGKEGVKNVKDASISSISHVSEVAKEKLKSYSNNPGGVFDHKNELLPSMEGTKELFFLATKKLIELVLSPFGVCAIGLLFFAK